MPKAKQNKRLIEIPQKIPEFIRGIILGAIQDQDAKTRKMTLEEMGEWLDDSCVTFRMGKLRFLIMEDKYWEALKQGKMPE